MCGIAGIYGLEDKNLLIKMLDSIKYRGPDDQGIFIDKDCSIGHVRLNIIDLTSAGRNPVYNEDKTILVVYNGEIYNFRSLRKELEIKHHIFYSKTDTEVIVHAYEEWGIDCVKKFIGMFAFALYDIKKKKLYLCRDQFGIKPLFYFIQDNIIFFSSEIRALLKTNYLKPEINKLGLYYGLSFLCTPAPFTLYERIKKLVPGHYMEIDSARRIRIVKYYDINKNLNNFNESLESAISKGEHLLRESIDLMRFSDVPQGVLLSGGIDSSTIVAILSDLESIPVETFSIGMAGYGEEFNELKWANLIHEKFETNHHEYLIEEQEVPKLMEEFLNEQYDFTADPACLLTYKLSKNVKMSKVKVVHVGEGADEIYCGYPSYFTSLRYAKGHSYYQKLPTPVKNRINGYVNTNLKHFEKFFEKSNKLNIYYSILKQNDLINKDRVIPDRGIIGFSEAQKEFLLNKEMILLKTSKDNVYDLLKALNRNTPDLNVKESHLQDTRYLEFKIRLPELILMRVDNNTMLSSIEARVPYFDKNLVEYNLSLCPPLKYHYKNRISKYLLKRIMKDKLPKEILNRKKVGLATPISWNNSLNFSDMIETEFSRNYMKEYFKEDFLIKMIKSRKYRDNFAPLYPWLLVNFSYLYRKVILNERIVF